MKRLDNSWDELDHIVFGLQNQYYSAKSPCIDLTHPFQNVFFSIYRKIYNIRRAKSRNLNVSCLVLQLSSCNILKSGIKSRMKSSSNYIWVINNSIIYTGATSIMYRGLTIYLSKVGANKRDVYIFEVASHWLRPCSHRNHNNLIS